MGRQERKGIDGGRRAHFGEGWKSLSKMKETVNPTRMKLATTTFPLGRAIIRGQEKKGSEKGGREEKVRRKQKKGVRAFELRESGTRRGASRDRSDGNEGRVYELGRRVGVVE